MKKIFKTIFLAFILLFFILIGNSQASNSISSINMSIYVDSDGSARVSEVWNCSSSEGTEVYHPYYNLGNSEIIDFSVSEGNTVYENIESWNTSASFSSKAYKCGINNISDGIELCWGISSYGKHTYTLNYTITNFVSELNDSQMIYWTLIPYDFSNPIGNVYIKIYSDFDYGDSIPVWGYGNYGGTCYVYDGYIEMQSDGELDSDEYMTILVKFPLETFNTTNFLDNNFDYYLNLAEEESTHYSDDSILLGLFVFIFIIAFAIVLFIIPFYVSSKSTSLSFGKTGNKVPNNVPLFRDIPCRGDIFRAYFVAYNYNLMKKKTDFLGAMLLRWLKESKIQIEKREVGKIFKKEDTCILLNSNLSNNSTFDYSLEQELYDMFFKASKDGILEEREFEKWCSKNYSKILNWFDKVLDYERDILIGYEKITEQEVSSFKIFKSKKYVVDDSLMEEAKQLKGLKKFLEEFTLIDKREAIEVTLFEQYLMFAQILGVAKKVASQFKKLYPEIIDGYNYDYDDILLIYAISNSGISNANSAKSRAESYSSGGGGFSSGGGRRWLFWWTVVAGGGFR